MRLGLMRCYYCDHECRTECRRCGALVCQDCRDCFLDICLECLENPSEPFSEGDDNEDDG